MGERILVIDDERGIRLTFESFLSDEGYEVHTAGDYAEAAGKLSSLKFGLVFTDIVLGDRGGLDILRRVRETDPVCPVVMITGYPNVDSAAEAVRLGAFDYLPKPVVQETLLRVTRQALRHRALVDEKERYRANLEAIFEGVGEAIISVDRRMTITAVNSAAIELCGSTDGSVGTPLAFWVSGCEMKCLEALRESLELCKPARLNRLECRRTEGRTRVVSVASYPIAGPGREAAGGILVIRDDTRLEELERELGRREGFHRIVGRSGKMQRIYSLIQALSDYTTTVLITGESGTGKELVAEAIHCTGVRSRKPLVKVNCSALGENLLESELFGHTRGAFTGALRERKGRFEEADGGTIFLDEIGDISPRMQLSLLRVLQEMEFERVGESTPVRVDVRVIAATNSDLRDKVTEGSFRQDLYYRLKVVEIAMPPLRERMEDLPLLITHFVGKFREKFRRDISGVTREVADMFARYSWPGNVRELEHLIEHAFLLCRGNTITSGDLPADFSPPPPALPQIDQREKDVTPEEITRALREAAWNKARAAVLLGISRSTLYRKIREHRITSDDPLKRG